MMKLKHQYFGHLMQKADSLEKTLMLGRIEGRRGRGQQKTRWLNGINDSMDTSLSKFWEIVKDREALCAAKTQTQLSDWTTTMIYSQWTNNLKHLALVRLLFLFFPSGTKNTACNWFYYYSYKLLPFMESHKCIPVSDWWQSNSPNVV